MGPSIDGLRHASQRDGYFAFGRMAAVRADWRSENGSRFAPRRRCSELGLRRRRDEVRRSRGTNAFARRPKPTTSSRSTSRVSAIAILARKSPHAISRGRRPARPQQVTPTAGCSFAFSFAQGRDRELISYVNAVGETRRDGAASCSTRLIRERHADGSRAHSRRVERASSKPSSRREQRSIFRLHADARRRPTPTFSSSITPASSA